MLKVRSHYSAVMTCIFVLVMGVMGVSAQKSVEVNCCASNTAPEAVDDEVFVAEGATSSSFNVISNDFDEDGDTLSFSTVVTQPQHGTLTHQGGGKFTYAHNGSETTTDGFTYKVSDGSTTSLGFVTIWISPVNDAPNAVDDSNLGSPLEGATVGFNVLANDSDPENDPLTVSIAVQPTHGTASVNQNVVVYAHNGSENFSDSLTYSISDGKGGVDTATLAIQISPVNDKPDAQNDNATVNEGGSIQVTVLSNDSDAEGNALSVTIETQPAHGSATSGANNTITYTHDGTDTTTDSFTYIVNDGFGGSDTATVVITVTPVADTFELVTNGGFETAGTSAALPQGWSAIKNKKTGDRRICNGAKIFTPFENCALRFSSTVATTRSIQQSINVANLTQGDTLNLTVEAKSALTAGSSTVVVKIYYPNTATPQLLKVSIPRKTTGWLHFISATQITLSQQPSKVLVVIQTVKSTGSVFFDNISIINTPNRARSDAFLPLPAGN